MKKRTLITLALVQFFSLNSKAIETIYPGCPIPPQECVCDVLPDLYNYGVMFGAVGCETRKIIFSGFIQTDYQFIDVQNRTEFEEITFLDIDPETDAPRQAIVEVHDPTGVNNFAMRHVRFRTHAILGDNWSGLIEFDFASKDHGVRFNSPQTVDDEIITTRHKHGIFGIADAYIEKYCANQFFRAGHRKVRFGYEELIPDCELKNIERSIASEYFSGSIQPSPLSGSPLGFDSRHIGIFWDGAYNDFNYGASLVNGFQGTAACSDITNNELGIFGGIGYMASFGCLDLEIGVNAGYVPKGNSPTLLLPEEPPLGNHDLGLTDAVSNTNGIGIRASITGINPYLSFSWNNIFYGWIEALAARVEKGQDNGVTTAKPSGVTIASYYMWNDCLELAFRASFLDTNFRGVRISNVIHCAPDTIIFAQGTGPFFAGDVYNKAREFYTGFNYYWLNRAMMFSVGYEWAQFRDRGIEFPGVPISNSFKGAKTNVHQVRARLQLVF